MRIRMLGSICALLLLAPSARSAEGALEINQHCATVTGCVDGDAPGFPVTANGGASYVLTSSLTVADADVTAVQLGGGGTLDLNGFSITGPAVCTGTPPSCVGLGSGLGIHTFDRSIVRNGRITGMGNNGIYGSGAVTLEKLVVEGNGDDGIGVGSGSLVRECRVLRNEGNGIQAPASTGTPVLIQRSVVFGNGESGITNEALIVDTAIYGNAGVGFTTSAEIGLGYSALWGNAGGSGQPQGSGGFTEVGPNVCDGGACP